MAFVGWRLASAAMPVRWREVVLQTGSGAFLATFLAFGVEAIFGLFTLFAVLLSVALTPNGMAWLQELTANLQDPLWIADPVNVSQVLLSPPIAIALVLVFVVIAPLGEELFKPLGVALMSYRRPGAARAFLWGVAGGAGFAMAEGLFNSAVALESWSAVVLLRVGSTLMHCLGSGLMGLGWYHLLRTRRPWHILATYVASVGLHVLWNVGAIGMAAISLGAMAFGADKVSLALSGLGLLVLGAYLILLTLFMAFAIYYLTGREREEQLSPSSALCD
jgi:RsiW-degrading membrane proteinase PrsW (M82 family)